MFSFSGLLTQVEAFATSHVGVISILTIFVSGIGLGALFIQIRQAHRQQIRQFEISRRNETLGFYNDHREKIRNLHACLIAQAGETDRFSALSKESAQNIRNNDEHRKNAQNLLSLLERISTGVEFEIYEFYVFYKLSRSQFLSMWGFYFEYIKLAREDSPLAYKSFEALARRIAIKMIRDNLPIPKRLENSNFDLKSTWGVLWSEGKTCNTYRKSLREDLRFKLNG